MEDRAGVRLYGCGLTNAWALGAAVSVPASIEEDEVDEDVAEAKGKLSFGI